MELDFTEEQKLLKNTVDRTCIKYSDLKSLREIEDSEKGYSEDFWNQLINLGLTGIGIPSKYGGWRTYVLPSCQAYVNPLGG